MNYRRLRHQIILLVIFLFCACTTFKSKNYSLVRDDMNIWVEKFDSTETDLNKYDHDNKIFKPLHSFIYSFEHIKKDGSRWSFEYIDSVNDWEFVPYSSFDKIEKIAISVMAGNNPITFSNPNYNQTVLSYSYWTSNNMASFGSHSGVIENEKNIWMHPPRDQYFKILEINPFPYVQSPLKIGNNWAWCLDVGEFWSDSRWKEWNGTIKINYNYEIVDYKPIETDLGKLKCYIIECVGESIIGKTKLISFFNKKYGFVKLNYYNIDGSQTNLDLVEINSLNP